MKALCVVEHGNAPSTRLRLTDCLDRYSRAGIQTTLFSGSRAGLRSKSRLLKQAARHDVVVLFKTLGFSPLELNLLRRQNPRIIFDFDDAVMFRDQKYQRPLRSKTFRKFVRTLKRCRAAVAGNEFLARMAEACGTRTFILPTAVDISKYKLKEARDGLGLTIGWMGLSDGLVYLQHIHEALRQVSEKFPGLTLKIISDKPLQLEGVKVENHTWTNDTEQQHLASFDVGIMPLWDSLWTRGKCGYKILQYMGVGTPVIASDVGANRDIVTSGQNGFLARTQDDWVEALTNLIQDAGLRKTFGARGRDLIEQRYSLDHFANSYAALIQEVAKS
jgi:glycosyltransferase involved in cell wall biosynthesis